MLEICLYTIGILNLVYADDISTFPKDLGLSTTFETRARKECLEEGLGRKKVSGIHAKISGSKNKGASVQSIAYDTKPDGRPRGV